MRKLKCVGEKFSDYMTTMSNENESQNLKKYTLIVIYYYENTFQLLKKVYIIGKQTEMKLKTKSFDYYVKQNAKFNVL